MRELPSRLCLHPSGKCVQDEYRAERRKSQPHSLSLLSLIYKLWRREEVTKLAHVPSGGRKYDEAAQEILSQDHPSMHLTTLHMQTNWTQRSSNSSDTCPLKTTFHWRLPIFNFPINPFPGAVIMDTNNSMSNSWKQLRSIISPLSEMKFSTLVDIR